MFNHILSYIKPIPTSNLMSTFDSNSDERRKHQINDNSLKKLSDYSPPNDESECESDLINNSSIDSGCDQTTLENSNDCDEANVHSVSYSHQSPISLSSATITLTDVCAVTEAEYETLVCQICLSLMLPPVTLPCKHEMCLQCYKKSMDVVNLLCPFCRLRISCWSRNATKRDQIVNRDKLQQIKSKYPQFVNSAEDCAQKFDIFLKIRPINRVISSDGEIGKEFQVLIDKEREIQLKEEQQNELLIKQLLDEDMKLRNETMTQLNDQTMDDESIARRLQDEENQRISDFKRSRDSGNWYEFRRRKQIKYTEPDYDEFN